MWGRSRDQPTGCRCRSAAEEHWEGHGSVEGGGMVMAWICGMRLLAGVTIKMHAACSALTKRSLLSCPLTALVSLQACVCSGQPAIPCVPDRAWQLPTHRRPLFQGPARPGERAARAGYSPAAITAGGGAASIAYDSSEQLCLLPSSAVLDVHFWFLRMHVWFGTLLLAAAQLSRN